MTAPAAPFAPSRDAGAVLVAVLWMLSILGALTMAMALYTTNSLSAVDVYGDRVKADAVINAGVELAAARILRSEKAVAGSGSSQVGGARVAFGYSGETARIDLNAAAPELLAGIFTALGARSNDASAYADRIVQMRQTGAGGADPGAANARRRFLDVAELALVPGLPEALAARAAPFLTVYSGSAQIDARLAAPEILAALPGMTRERVRLVLALRGRDPDPQAWADALGPAQAYTTDTRGRSARIRVRADLGDGFAAASEVVILQFEDDAEPYRILSWEDDVDLRP